MKDKFRYLIHILRTLGAA